MPSLFQIVTSTPPWVWPLMLFVLWLGWMGLRPRTLSPLRLAILPLVSLGMSLAAIAQSLQPGLALAGWLVALLASLPVGYVIGAKRTVRRADDGRLAIAGGWFTLCFGLSIFVVRYAMGVLFGVLPHLRAESLWIALSGGVGGLVTGIGVGWLGNLLWRDYRMSPT